MLMVQFLNLQVPWVLKETIVMARRSSVGTVSSWVSRCFSDFCLEKVIYSGVRAERLQRLIGQDRSEETGLSFYALNGLYHVNPPEKKNGVLNEKELIVFSSCSVGD
jgi:hypothetical protein